MNETACLFASTITIYLLFLNRNKTHFLIFSKQIRRKLLGDRQISGRNAQKKPCNNKSVIARPLIEIFTLIRVREADLAIELARFVILTK